MGQVSNSSQEATEATDVHRPGTPDAVEHAEPEAAERSQPATSRQPTPEPTRSDPDAGETARGQRTVTVTVIDAESGAAISGALVVLTAGKRDLLSGGTDAAGRLTLAPVPGAKAVAAPATELALEVVAAEHESSHLPLGEDAERVEVRLTPIEATATTSNQSFGATAKVHSEVLRPETTLEGLALQEQVRGSVPESIAQVPGVSVAFNGPGAARPTIRGLGGDRVLMLDDGYRVGDLYWSASDHGVMVEPLSAHRLEVVRGPATLVYGGNALGGVVNIISDQVPQRAEKVAVAVGAQGETANRGLAQAGNVVAPLGPLTLRLEESIRSSGDVRTARGPIPNTSMDTLGASAGLAVHPSWGHVGAAVRYYQNDYGVPGEFGGVLIPGGHPGGANIEARRFNGRFTSSYRPTGDGPIERVELGGSFTRYLHDEVEGVIAGQRALGASFDLDTAQANLVVRHRLFDSAALPIRGAAGLSTLNQDLVAGGNSPGVRSGQDLGLAGFVFERIDLDAWSFHIGGRYEHRRLTPDWDNSIRVRTTDRMIEKSVSARTFNLLSGSLAAMWAFAEGWTAGTTVARSSRAPNLQELYSDGPHLADFSFDIGTPSLPTEVGTGVDLYLLAELPWLDFEITAFVNLVDDYVLYAPTVETVRVFREGSRPRDTPVFEARPVDALFLGAEGKVRVPIGAGFSAEGVASYVWAKRRDDGDPLPYIPPFNGRLSLRFEAEGFFATAGVSGALRQGRVPRAVEAGGGFERPQEPTAGYALAHASAGYRGDLLGMTHTLTLRGENLGNRLWRDHLSRIKDVAPQTGLNVALTYQLQY